MTPYSFNVAGLGFEFAWVLQLLNWFLKSLRLLGQCIVKLVSLWGASSGASCSAIMLMSLRDLLLILSIFNI